MLRFSDWDCSRKQHRDIPVVFEVISNSGDSDVNLVIQLYTRSNTEKYPLIVLPRTPRFFNLKNQKLASQFTMLIRVV